MMGEIIDTEAKPTGDGHETAAVKLES